MQASHRQTYLHRIHRVVDHIGTHLADPLDLHTLAAVANFSPWHFHRLFLAATGETLADCVRRLRVEEAGRRLLLVPPQPALAVALDVGFASAEVFSRAFRAHFGMTPTAWRRGGWRGWSARRQHELRKIHQALRKQDQDAGPAPGEDASSWPPFAAGAKDPTIMNVELKTLPAMRLAYLRHVGPYGHPGINDAWQRFAAWCGQQGLMHPRPRMYGISLDDPTVTAPEKCRYDCCVAVPDGVAAQGEIGIQAFAGGRYACVWFTGSADRIHDAWMAMFSRWLPSSGWQPADKAALELYEPDFRIDPLTGAFGCWLCVPVRPLS